MPLFLELDKGVGYESASQKIRVLTEGWVSSAIYCPGCGRTVSRHPNNTPVADFFCPYCNEDYELKSKKDAFGVKIVDGAYNTMIERLLSSTNPNFFFLNYSSTDFSVVNFLVIPKHYFVPEIIEKRKPLAPTARRAGWVGCNISLRNVPQAGKIFYVRNGQVQPQEHVLSQWKKTLFLREESEISTKGWLLDVMRSIDGLGKREFALEEIYACEAELGRLHPDNRHIRDKIRQQLQILRDKGYLEFALRGHYRLT